MTPAIDATVGSPEGKPDISQDNNSEKASLEKIPLLDSTGVSTAIESSTK
jgi:hypothetical protein